MRIHRRHVLAAAVLVGVQLISAVGPGQAVAQAPTPEATSQKPWQGVDVIEEGQRDAILQLAHDVLGTSPGADLFSTRGEGASTGGKSSIPPNLMIGRPDQLSARHQANESPTVQILRYPDGRLRVQLFPAVDMASPDLLKGVTVHGHEYVISTDGSIGAESSPPPGMTLKKTQTRSSAVAAKSLRSRSIQQAVVTCWWVIWTPEIMYDYSYFVYDHDLINCDAPGGVVDTITILSFFFGGERAVRPIYVPRTAGMYGWEAVNEVKFRCGAVTTGDYYWGQQVGVALTPGFPNQNNTHLSPGTIYLWCN